MSNLAVALSSGRIHSALLGCHQESGPSLRFEPIAIDAAHDGVTVLQQTLKEAGRADRITEDFTPLADRAIWRQYAAAAIVAKAHELEAHERRISLNGQIATFIDDQQLWCAVRDELLVEAPMLALLDDLRDLDATEFDAHVCFPDTAWPE